MTAVGDNSTLDHVLAGGMLEVFHSATDELKEGVFGAVHIDSSGASICMIGKVLQSVNSVQRR